MSANDPSLEPASIPAKMCNTLDEKRDDEDDSKVLTSSRPEKRGRTEDNETATASTSKASVEGDGAPEAKRPAKDAEEGGGGDKENVVTMVDVLEDEAALEEDAEAVLGGADDKNCTYFTGGERNRDLD